MSDPQTWSLIGVFAAAMLGGLTLVVTTLTRVIRAEVGGLHSTMTAEISGLRNEMTAEIGGLRSEMTAEIGGLRSKMTAEISGFRGDVSGEIGGLRGEIVGLHARLEALEKRFDHLDRDVQSLIDRIWRRDES